MKTAPWALAALSLALASSIVGCQQQTTGPTNHSPIITSLTVLPTSLGPTDSVVVTCIAADQDGDTLVYDWSTDLRLRIKGCPPDFPIKNQSPYNYETFYGNYTPVSQETVYVACTVRDRIGGGAAKAVTFILHP